MVINLLLWLSKNTPLGGGGGPGGGGCVEDTVAEGHSRIRLWASTTAPYYILVVHFIS